MNPHNSPWLNKNTKPNNSIWSIKDAKLRAIYSTIKFHATTDLVVSEHHNILTINKKIYLAKNSIKFRLLSHLDWAWYTPKTLAQAIDSDTVDSYYEIMLAHVNSDPNVWKDTDFEMDLKSFYAARIGRANLI
jgi:hypothetical protein